MNRTKTETFVIPVLSSLLFHGIFAALFLYWQHETVTPVKNLGEYIMSGIHFIETSKTPKEPEIAKETKEPLIQTQKPLTEKIQHDPVSKKPSLPQVQERVPRQQIKREKTKTTQHRSQPKTQTKSLSKNAPTQNTKTTGSSPRSISKTNPSAKGRVDLYLTKVRSRIQNSVRYPILAKRSGMEGLTVLRFIISKSGTVDSNSITIQKTSGNRLLDKEAMHALLRAMPFDIPPKTDMNVIVPIAFKIKS
ncbi:MAG: energy transducer TonB [Campylobacterales bacterium]|nr:energy transducer TonB [Campylobacterales bacterium]